MYRIYAQPRSDRDDSDLDDKVLVYITDDSDESLRAMYIVKEYYKLNDVKVWQEEEFTSPMFATFDELVFKLK